MPLYAGQWGPEGMEYPNGQRAVNAPFMVETIDGDILVPLYEDKEQTVPKDNPGRTDAMGNLSFFAPPGTYQLRMSGVTMLITVQRHPDEPTGPGGSIDPVVDWFTGEGPPPDVIPGAGAGDMYVDTLTGVLYQLR